MAAYLMSRSKPDRQQSASSRRNLPLCSQPSRAIATSPILTQPNAKLNSIYQATPALSRCGLRQPNPKPRNQIFASARTISKQKTGDAKHRRFFNPTNPSQSAAAAHQ
jgi:hypothetical protein